MRHHDRYLLKESFLGDRFLPANLTKMFPRLEYSSSAITKAHGRMVPCESVVYKPVAWRRYHRECFQYVLQNKQKHVARVYKGLYDSYKSVYDWNISFYLARQFDTNDLLQWQFRRLLQRPHGMEFIRISVLVCSLFSQLWIIWKDDGAKVCVQNGQRFLKCFSIRRKWISYGQEMSR